MNYGPNISANEDHLQELMGAMANGRSEAVISKLVAKVSASGRGALLFPSNAPEYWLRPPLAAAAATGNIVVFRMILDRIVSECNGRSEESRETVMNMQLQMQDLHGSTLLMQAAGCGNVEVLHAVAEECRRLPKRKLRRVVKMVDDVGRNFVMYAASAGRIVYPGANGRPLGGPPLQAQEDMSPQRRTGDNPERESLLGDSQSFAPCAEIRAGDKGAQSLELPSSGHDETRKSARVLRYVLEFAKASIILPEYRLLLKKRDKENMCTIEHSIMSGQQELFETIIHFARRDTYDEELDYMLDPHDDPINEQSAMKEALASADQDMRDCVADTREALKRDVTLRAEASTVEFKMQSFIPGNLIVVFQLLLPELDEDGWGPLIMLGVLCAMAPWWSKVASIRTTRDPQVQRQMASPSTLAWGIGTSTIAEKKWNWSPTAAPAAMGVATIVIPSVDTFLAGPAARVEIGKFRIRLLDCRDWIVERCLCSRPTPLASRVAFDSSRTNQHQTPTNGGHHFPHEAQITRESRERDVEEGLPVGASTTGLCLPSPKASASAGGGEEQKSVQV